MADTLVTFPGKIGDMFLQWPVAHSWIPTPFDVGIPHILAGVHNLIHKQSCVDKVYYLHGINHYQCGGQPYDFSIPDRNYKKWKLIRHMGFRTVPTENITLHTAKALEFPTNGLDGQHIFLGERRTKNYCVLHGNTKNHTQNVPRFWGVIALWWKLLEKEFDRLVFVGTDQDLALAEAICPNAERFDDYGDWLATAELMNDARLILGCGSAVAALGGVMGLPTIRIHDDIPGFSKEIWTNLGSNQLNYSPSINDTDQVLGAFLEEHCPTLNSEKIG